jgi:putative phosphoribosyl transferase
LETGGSFTILFSNRIEAGKKLAQSLQGAVGRDAIVLAIPRGGVIVGYEVARKLKVPLDLIIPRKIGAPDNPELAIGAIAEDGTIIIDNSLIKYLGVSKSYISEESKRQLAEIQRRLRLYRGETPYPDLRDKEVIIVDDGIATGSTMKAAVASTRVRGAKTVIIAVPVCPGSSVSELEKEADRVICLQTPEPFYAIGQFYGDFDQISDQEVIDLLKQSGEETNPNNHSDN